MTWRTGLSSVDEPDLDEGDKLVDPY